MWDSEHLSQKNVNEILQGAMDKLIESKCALVGGHSINDREQKFGLSITGIIKDGIFWRNNTAKKDDSIILTKPIGSGILSTAFKNNILAFDKNLDVVKSMKELNIYATREAKNFNIHAATDVTGFGLLGHLIEMTNDDISINLHLDNVLKFDKVCKLAKQGVIPSGSYRNKEALKSKIKNNTKEDDIIYYDAQTSGGLLISLDSKDAIKLNKILNQNQIRSSIIAECISKKDYKIYLK